jgi:protein-S-isoprenylcysteine O-methyltransferase Ste14
MKIEPNEGSDDRLLPREDPVNNEITLNPRIMPPTLLFACLVAMIGLRLVFPGLMLFSVPVVLGGVVMIIAGLVTTIGGDQQFKKARTPVSPLDTPTTLVTGGFYRYTRNPMYLGFALILGGVWLMLGALTPLIGVLVFVVVIDRWNIPYEEWKMTQVFGSAYQAYRSQVRRWI